jgi:predicted nucleic acid-binding protein
MGRHRASCAGRTGLSRRRKPESGSQLQRLQLALAAWKLWPITEEAAFEYGRIAAELRRIGRRIGENEMWIAANALTLGNCTVVTMDDGFAAVQGLAIENWAADESPKGGECGLGTNNTGELASSSLVSRVRGFPLLKLTV